MPPDAEKVDKVAKSIEKQPLVLAAVIDTAIEDQKVTTLSDEETAAVLTQLAEDYKGAKYKMVHR